jgi:hypothetical protein
MSVVYLFILCLFIKIVIFFNDAVKRRAYIGVKIIFPVNFLRYNFNIALTAVKFKSNLNKK